MLFYRVEVDLDKNKTDTERKGHSEMANALQSKTEVLFARWDYETHIAVADMMAKKRKCVLCAAVKNEILTEFQVAGFLADVDLAHKSFTIEEITLDAYFSLLRSAMGNNFIADDDEVTRKLNIYDLDKRYYSPRNDYTETLIGDVLDKKELVAQSKSLLCDGALLAELDRIFEGKNESKASGHPVHYIIQSDNREVKNKVLKILLSALYQNGRIKSRRCIEISYNAYDYVYERSYGILYGSTEGGVMAVSFSGRNDSEEEHARFGTDVIVALCDGMRKAKNDVLTVFCLPKDNPKIKDAFLEHLGAVTVVTISEETAFEERAIDYLRGLAKSRGVRADKSLTKTIVENRGYSSAELNMIFDEWYDRILKTKVYSQYAGLETANKQVALAKPKGSAYDDLTRLIGLREAKGVLQQALDFYKAQKLFASKGFSGERPVMHMVFTGNPGTAKTEVARLFAKIMKDNELLSVGDLYEVGRADLVGKYVGWTAPLVSQKFKAAKGSVLFIDEAYSLVDDRDGMYGDEAINTIVQEMENHRDDMVVIFAGYPDKMESFIQKNPGLRSRIAFHVKFPDYSNEELYNITELMAQDRKLRLDCGVRDKLMSIYDSAMKAEDFGNGRYVRNLLEKAIMKQATRLLTMDVDAVTVNDIELLLADDFEVPPIAADTKRRIGF